MRIPAPRTTRRQAGATMIEYAIMASLIAAVVIVGVRLLGTETTNLFDETQKVMPK